MSNLQEIERAESLQVQIEARLGISKPHLSVKAAALKLQAAFESLAFLDPRIGDLSGLIADQEQMLAGI